MVVGDGIDSKYKWREGLKEGQNVDQVLVILESPTKEQ